VAINLVSNRSVRLVQEGPLPLSPSDLLEYIMGRDEWYIF